MGRRAVKRKEKEKENALSLSTFNLDFLCHLFFIFQTPPLSRLLGIQPSFHMGMHVGFKEL
jgi:hypothetical protein